MDMDLRRELETLERHRLATDKRACAVQMGVLFEVVMRRGVAQAPAEARAEGLAAAGRALEDLTVGHLVHLWGAMGLFASDAERSAFERARDVRNWAAHAKGKGPKWKTVEASIDALWAATVRLALLPAEERGRIAERVAQGAEVPAAPAPKLGLTLSAWGCSLQLAVGVGAVFLVSVVVDDLWSPDAMLDDVAPAAVAVPEAVPEAVAPDPPAATRSEGPVPGATPAEPRREVEESRTEEAKPEPLPPPKPRPKPAASAKRKAKRAAKLSAGRGGGAGAGESLSRTAVLRVLQRSMRRFHACDRDGQAPERVRLTLTVRASGSVSSASVGEADAAWARCVVAHARRMKFPAARSESTFSYPLRFPQRAPPAPSPSP